MALKIDMEPAWNACVTYTVWVLGLTAGNCGSEPTACCRPAWRDPFRMVTVALKRLVT